jgi:hypothetical protein
MKLNYRFYLSVAAILLLAGRKNHAAEASPAETARQAEAKLGVAASGVFVPMLDFGGRPGVAVRINGKGPFPFIVDTGASRTVVESSLAEELSLASAGAENTIAQLEIGDVSVRDVAVVVGPLLSIPGKSATPRGVLSPTSFADYLMTFDFPRRQISLRSGALEQPNDKTIFSYESNGELPTVPVRVSGHEYRVHLDTGAPFALALPTKYKDEVLLEGPLEEAKKARTPSGEFQIYKGTMKSEAEIGAYKIPGRAIFFSDAVPSPRATPRGQVGCLALAGLAVTLDSRNRRIEFVKGTPAGI